MTVLKILHIYALLKFLNPCNYVESNESNNGQKNLGNNTKIEGTFSSWELLIRVKTYLLSVPMVVTLLSPLQDLLLSF